MMMTQPFKLPANIELIRCVICNPIDELFFKKCIKADDIKLITSTYIEAGQAIYSKDCTVIFIPKMGWVHDDFINNEITIIPNYEIT